MGNRERVKIIIRGAVQGVGFRPFVYRLAQELGLCGWVLNSTQGVTIEAEGTHAHLKNILLRLQQEKPPQAVIQSLEFSFLDPLGYEDFEIRYSQTDGQKTAFIAPDIATCADCLQEVFDNNDRRYLYPFTNCTNCGPRFSIIETLPYDRPNTSMKKFKMCETCEREYQDPMNRRFHAQPNACPNCGPHLELRDAGGMVLLKRHDALLQAAQLIRAGKIVALKGLGGFQLLVDAHNDEAVRKLRKRKNREEKPFALMYPTLESVRKDGQVSSLEKRLLLAPEAPIVLLARRPSAIAPSVAPNNPYLGIMLPYTPLHHILLRELDTPVVATSGNLSDEPICTDEEQARVLLKEIADVFLVHDRPIVRHVDDSIARIMLGRELILRRARGYAPLPIQIQKPLPGILAVGAHLKNTVALSVKNSVFVSQHIGDLETMQAYSAFRKVIADFKMLYEVCPQVIATDLHPDYLSTKYAQETGLQNVPVQHHYAHVVACMAENELHGPVLGVSWDGTGFGPDGTIHGGEFLLTNTDDYGRVGHFRPFKLPGGEASIKQPRRTALGLLYEIFGETVSKRDDLIPVRCFSEHELAVLNQMLTKGISTPITSSAGRLFDAVASIIGLRQNVNYEGQAAMELEFAILPRTQAGYAFEIRSGAPYVFDWEAMILAIVDDLRSGVNPGVISAKFHNTLSEVILEMARRIGQEKVVLTGGCFQNKYLTERTVRRLRKEGFRPYWHQRVPPNDGGIALGQLMAAVRVNKAQTEPVEVGVA